jgi:hypothetical protein
MSQGFSRRGLLGGLLAALFGLRPGRPRGATPPAPVPALPAWPPATAGTMTTTVYRCGPPQHPTGGFGLVTTYSGR